MSKIAETLKKTTWSTWEELLLGFSVKRHGLKDWDSVAMELRNRSSLPAQLTAQICKEKYRDLQRRFTNSDTIVDEDDGGSGGGGGGGDVVIPWLEDLRQLRVAELKTEVHRRDLSIQSLQLKAKRIEEEREQSMKERQNTAMKPDLENNREEKTENDEKNDEIAGKVVSGGNSEHENRSFNESNSVENKRTMENREPDPVHGRAAKPDPHARKNSDSHETSNTSQENKGNDVSKNDRRKEGSDVESSATLKKKRRRLADARGGELPLVAAMSPAIAVKSEPLVAFLDVIRTHKHGSVFKRRLKAQKTAKYKSIIRRHVDLETVQARLDDGSYSCCSTKFYLDLLLIFNNAIVFFPKSSSESVAAHELRSLVVNELKIMNNKTPKSEVDNSLPAKRSCTAAPIVVCRRRSSISGNTSPNNAPREDDNNSETKLKMKERPVTGVRSMRRTSKSRLHHSQPTKQPDDDEVVIKPEKKKEQVISSTDKKRGAADFLKRIKKSSPTKATTSPETQKKSPNDDGVKGGGEGRKQLKRKATEKKDGPTTRQNGSGNGGAAKKSKEERFPARRSVGRPRRGATSEKLVKENTNKDDYSKRPMKRSRR